MSPKQYLSQVALDHALDVHTQPIIGDYTDVTIETELGGHISIYRNGPEIITIRVQQSNIWAAIALTDDQAFNVFGLLAEALGNKTPYDKDLK